MVLAQTQASDQWAFYQAKSIKETSYQVQRDMMDIQRKQSPEAEALYAPNIAAYDKEVSRYKKEKAEIMADAQKLEKVRDTAQFYAARFGEALILLQIGILLSSLATISKNHVYWYGGSITGGAGVAYFIYFISQTGF